MILGGVLNLREKLGDHFLLPIARGHSDYSSRFRAPQMADRANAPLEGPRTISLIARGTPPMARAITLWEIPSGVRYSASRISPDGMGGLIAGVYFAFALAGSLAVTSGNFLMSS